VERETKYMEGKDIVEMEENEEAAMEEMGLLWVLESIVNG